MSREISENKRKEVYEKYDKHCAYCGIDLNFEDMQIDHVIPKYRKWTNDDLSKYNKTKGTDELQNLNPSCRSCNISKGTFTLEEWRNELEYKIDRIRKESASFRILERYKLVLINRQIVKFYFENFNN